MSNLGEVIDLSATGLRVNVRKVPAGEFEVHIYNATEGVTVIGQVVWSRRAGLMRREIGVNFLDVTPETAKVIARIAGTNRFRRAM
jgi:hypothetical protein